MSTPSQLDSTHDLWHVRLPSGEVRTMSLDELDAAFQAGHIGEDAALCRVGGTQWAKLGDLAGLEEETPTHNLAPQTPSPFAVDVPSVRPVAADVAIGPLGVGSPLSAGGVDIDLPPEGFRPTIKRKTVVGVAIAMGVLLGVVLAVTKADGTAEPAVVAAVGVAVDSTLPPIVAAAKAADPPAAATSATPASAADPGALGARLSNDQRKALLEVDKAHAQQRKVRSAPARGAPRTSGKPVFHKGGSKYDPLNSSI